MQPEPYVRKGIAPASSDGCMLICMFLFGGGCGLAGWILRGFA